MFWLSFAERFIYLHECHTISEWMKSTQTNRMDTIAHFRRNLMWPAGFAAKSVIVLWWHRFCETDDSLVAVFTVTWTEAHVVSIVRLFNIVSVPNHVLTIFAHFDCIHACHQTLGRAKMMRFSLDVFHANERIVILISPSHSQQRLSVWLRLITSSKQISLQKSMKCHRRNVLVVEIFESHATHRRIEFYSRCANSCLVSHLVNGWILQRSKKIEWYSVEIVWFIYSKNPTE